MIPTVEGDKQMADKHTPDTTHNDAPDPAMAALLAQGRPGHRIDEVRRGSGTGSCQVFMLFDPEYLGGREACDTMVDGITAGLAACAPAEPGGVVRWPGASVQRRRHSDAPVEVADALWRDVQRLAGE